MVCYFVVVVVVFVFYVIVNNLIMLYLCVFVSDVNGVDDVDVVCVIDL